ncbi:Uncharacterised protein [Chlamydia trachomatis]|nr:Uncharacterised protein [Chlamydia trachomatis]
MRKQKRQLQEYREFFSGLLQSVKTRKSHLFSFSTMAEAHLLSAAQPN